MKNSHIIITAFFLLFLLLISPVSADEDTIIAVQFQDLGIVTQDFVIFNDDGDDIIHSNTSSTVRLDWNESTFYTIQLQPTPMNMKPETWYDTILNFVMKYYIAIFLLIGLIVVISRK